MLFFEHDSLAIGTPSQRRGFDAPAITGIVKRLEQSGLVERQPNREDRRVVKVYLTDEGREITPTLSAAVAQFNATMTRGFSSDEEKDLLEKMQQLIANLAAVAPVLTTVSTCCPVTSMKWNDPIKSPIDRTCGVLTNGVGARFIAPAPLAPWMGEGVRTRYSHQIFKQHDRLKSPNEKMPWDMRIRFVCSERRLARHIT